MNTETRIIDKKTLELTDADFKVPFTRAAGYDISKLLNTSQYQELSEGFSHLYPLFEGDKVQPEGGTGSVVHIYLASLIYVTHAQLVYEIGMDVGLASLRMLNALKITEGRLRSFEYDSRKAPIADKLKELFPASFEIVWGDSTKTLPEQTDQPDIVFVDGCHHYEYVIQDIKNSLNLLKPGGFLVIDDVIGSEVGQAVKDLISEEQVHWFLNGVGGDRRLGRYSQGHLPGLAVFQKK